MTRWHDDDLAGRLIQQMRDAYKEVEQVCLVMASEGESEKAIAAYRKDELETIDAWEIISYPAIAEHDEYLAKDNTIINAPAPGARLLRRTGEALHPARYNTKKLLRKKRAMPPRYWSALYQQNPVPDEGEFFTKAMITYEPTPDWRTLPIVISGDLAIGQKQEHDYTALGVGCLDYNDKLHVIKVVHDRMDTYEIAEAILNLYQEFKVTTQTIRIGIERGALNLAVMPILKRRMCERKLYPSFDDELKPVTDKLIRARPLQGRMAQGMVCFPPDKGWVDPIVHDLLRFPGGVRKDRVDMLAWMVRMLTRVHAPEQARPKQRRKSWKVKLNKFIKGSARGGSAMAA